MPVWNPKSSNSGLTEWEQKAFSDKIRAEYERGERDYVNRKTKEQQTFTKMCIRCGIYFPVFNDEYFRTECHACRHTIGGIMAPDTKQMRWLSEYWDDEKSEDIASKQYAKESMEIIKLFKNDRKDEARAKMLEMEAKYPGRGWRKEHDELLKLEDTPTPQELGSGEETLPF